MGRLSDARRYELEENLAVLLEQLGESFHNDEARSAVQNAIRELPRSRDVRSHIAYSFRFQRWKRQYDPKRLGKLEQDIPNSAFDSLTAEISRVIDAIELSLGLERISVRDAAGAAGVALISFSLIGDFLIALLAAGVFEALKLLIRRLRSEQPRMYSEAELMEQAQRILAIRLSLPFDRLTLKAIETPGQQTAEEDIAKADFSVQGGDLYSVSIRMIRGIAVITNLRREVQPAVSPLSSSGLGDYGLDYRKADHDGLTQTARSDVANIDRR
jgi:hypothetical protein